MQVVFSSSVVTAPLSSFRRARSVPAQCVVVLRQCVAYSATLPSERAHWKNIHSPPLQSSIVVTTLEPRAHCTPCYTTHIWRFIIVNVRSIACSYGINCSSSSGALQPSPCLLHRTTHSSEIVCVYFVYERARRELCFTSVCMCVCFLYFFNL